jgi:hypothetical protein
MGGRERFVARREEVTRQLALVPEFLDLKFKPELYEVGLIDFKAARRLIEFGHYTHSLTKGRYCFGLFRSGFLVGAAVYGQPSGRHVAASLWEGGTEQNTLELLRLFVLDGTGENAETWFMARCHRQLRALGVRLLVAYSAPAAGHYGGCYQAGNWLYVGRTRTGQSYYYTDEDGTYVNKRIPWQYGPRNGLDLTEAQSAEILGLTRHKEPQKLTYVLPLDRKTLRVLKRTVLPYLKPELDDVGIPRREAVEAS